MHLGKLALGLLLGLALVGWADAQQGGGGGRGGGMGRGGRGNLVAQLSTNESLQKELKLDKDTIQKITDAVTKVREDMRDETAKLFGPNAQQLTREERAAIQKKINDAYDKAVSTILSADQFKRLHQIENQQLHLVLFESDDIKKTLKLTDEQSDQIKELNDELQKDIRDARAGAAGGQGGGNPGGGRGGRGGMDPETQKKVAALQKDAMDRVTKVLNDSQNAAVKDLLGVAFELQQPAFGGAGTFQLAGQIFSPNQETSLELTDDQKKQIEDLQKEIDAKISKILTDKQKEALKTLQTNPFAGRGGRGGNGGGGGGRGNRGGGGGANPGGGQ